MTNPTTTERPSDRELVIMRTFNGPAHLVYKAWTTPELLQRWWAPKSSGATLIGCDIDLRVGGKYRYEFAHPSSEQTMAFFGQYLEVVPNARIVWTNEDSGDQGPVSTLTLEEKDGQTHLRMSEVYPTKEAADEAAGGMAQGMPEQYEQLDDLLVELGA
jgi:uncharacterized protein YndB with AHSA1/START domain